MSRSRFLTLPAAAALGAAIAAASPAPAQGQSAVDAGAMNAPSAQVFPFFGARFGTPQRFSVAGGVGLDLDPSNDADQPSREVLLALSPGLGAERASLTYVYSTGRFGGGIAGGATVLRTIDHPWNAPANATYLGVDLSILPIIAIGPRIGLLHRVSRPTNEKPWIWTLDFGFGF